jgi:hypothetical protein
MGAPNFIYTFFLATSKHSKILEGYPYTLRCSFQYYIRIQELECYSFLLLYLSSCYLPTHNCNDYKTREFYSEVTIKDQLFKYTFTRNENLQVGIYN